MKIFAILWHTVLCYLLFTVWFISSMGTLHLVNVISCNKNSEQLEMCFSSDENHQHAVMLLSPWLLLPYAVLQSNSWESLETWAVFVIYMFPLSPLLVYWLHNWKTRQQDQWDSPGLWSSHQNCQCYWWLSYAPSHDHGLSGQHQRGPVPHQRQVRHYTGRPRPAVLHTTAWW